MKPKKKLVYEGDYEVSLRRIVCIFLSIETLLIYFLACKRILPEKNLFYIHTEGFINIISSTMLWMLIPVLLTTLSLFSISAYYIYEMIHFLMGGLLFFVLWWWGHLMIALIIILLFWARMIIYCHCMQAYARKCKNNFDSEI